MNAAYNQPSSLSLTHEDHVASEPALGQSHRMRKVRDEEQILVRRVQGRYMLAGNHVVSLDTA